MIATGKQLRGPPMAQRWCHDEKPLQPFDVDTETIIFGDLPSSGTHVTNFQERASSLSLLISTQGTGNIVHATLILPMISQSLSKDFLTIITDFEKRRDNNDDRRDVNIALAFTPNGYVNSQIYEEHLKRLYSNFAVPRPTADAPHLAQQDAHSSRGSIDNNRRINTLLTKLNVDNFFGQAHSSGEMQANDNGTNLQARIL